MGPRPPLLLDKVREIEVEKVRFLHEQTWNRLSPKAHQIRFRAP
jgi:hypothetical protein